MALILDPEAVVPTIRTRRTRLGLSQQALAGAADCSIAMLRLLEGGFVPKRSQVLGRVVAALEGAEAE